MQDPGTIRALSILLLLFTIICLSSYIYVLFYLMKCKVWRHPFYLQLMGLGCMECAQLLLLAFDFICSSVQNPILYPETLLVVFGICQELLESSAVWMYLMIGVNRAISIFWPMKARSWIDSKVGLCMIGSSFLYAVVFATFMETSFLIFVPERLTAIPWNPPNETFLGESSMPVATTLRVTPIALCIVIYIAASINLFLIHRRRTSVFQIHQNHHEARRFRAEMNMMKIAGILFVVFLNANILVVIMGDPGRERILVEIILYWLNDIILFGMNPFIYVATSSQVRKVLPITRGRNRQPTESTNDGQLSNFHN